jgi:hypothetical protein
MVHSQFNDDLPSRSQIFEYWKERLFDFGLFIDWGEPGCWACGFHYGAKYDIKQSDASWEEILRCWDRIPLQRCHIVPRSLEGSNDLANLFLMCRECHDQAPNTNISEIFFEWVGAQSWTARESSKISAALIAFGCDGVELAGLIDSEEFKSWMRGKFSLHRPQSRYAPVSSRLTPATFVGLAVHYRRISRLS